MKKNYKKNMEKFIKNGFIERFKNSTFKSNFAMIYIIHKMLLFFKIT